MIDFYIMVCYNIKNVKFKVKKMNNVDFNNLKIIKYLKEIHSEFYYKILEVYSLCEALLGEIPKLFSNYTIHDINHSIRVIKYMTDFLSKPLSNYSELHLAAIIYVGLMHDIGMFASDEEIEEIYKTLLFEDPNINRSPEVGNREIQDYIRINHGKRVEKSLEYRTNNGSSLKNQLYVNSYDISDIIVNVCRSHTESCEWIKEHLTGTRNIADYSINPIHLAVLLRLGDVLDIDDRRAPLSLYYALSPKGLSDKEWRKHIPITNYEKVSVNNDVFCINFEGESDNPEIFIALKHYIDDLSSDIVQINIILDQQDTPYKFVIKDSVYNHIKPVGFLPKEVTFKLQYKQIKKLLMGEHLYGGRENGLREIIQNSIDAVKLMQEINSSKPFASYEPIIEIFLNKEDNEIIITDNGIGMSESILDEYFFNIGNSYYKSNKYKEAGYEYKAIGKFGIGFLACFMLSSEVSVITKHYDSADIIRIDLNNNSDLIITKHMDAFPANSGTQVILRYDETINDVFLSEENLIRYIEKLLIVDRYKLIVKTRNSEINIQNTLCQKFSHEISGKKMNIYYNNDSFFEVIENCLSFTDNPCYMIFNNDEKDFFPEDDFLTIEYAYEIFTELEKYIALNYETFSYEDLINLFINESTLYNNDFQNFLCSHSEDIYDYYNLHENLVGYLDDYILRNSRVGNTIVWKEIPYFKKGESYSLFMEAILSGKDYQEMLRTHNINYISVFCAKEIDEELKMNILSKHFELMDYDIYFDYWEDYELDVIEKRVPILEKNNKYISIKKEYSFKQKDKKCDVYVNGILIPNANFVLPFVPAGFEHEHICVNITTDEYEITVARDDLTDQSRIKFVNDFIKEFLYGYVSLSNQLSFTEKQLIELFVTEYYQM